MEKMNQTKANRERLILSDRERGLAVHEVETAGLSLDSRERKRGGEERGVGGGGGGRAE